MPENVGGVKRLYEKVLCVVFGRFEVAVEVVGGRGKDVV